MSDIQIHVLFRFSLRLDIRAHILNATGKSLVYFLFPISYFKASVRHRKTVPSLSSILFTYFELPFQIPR